MTKYADIEKELQELRRKIEAVQQVVAQLVDADSERAGALEFIAGKLTNKETEEDTSIAEDMREIKTNQEKIMQELQHLKTGMNAIKGKLSLSIGPTDVLGAFQPKFDMKKKGK
jgi:septation ring formation regulator EzrA